MIYSIAACILGKNGSGPVYACRSQLPRLRAFKLALHLALPQVLLHRHISCQRSGYGDNQQHHDDSYPLLSAVLDHVLHGLILFIAMRISG